MTELEEKIYKGIELSEGELSEVIFECNVVDESYGENGRWNRDVSSIIKIEDKLFCLDWSQGLTECQFDLFENQPYEVEEKERTIVEKYYIRKNHD